jgi:hypothetical protein
VLGARCSWLLASLCRFVAFGFWHELFGFFAKRQINVGDGRTDLDRTLSKRVFPARRRARETRRPGRAPLFVVLSSFQSSHHPNNPSFRFFLLHEQVNYAIWYPRLFDLVFAGGIKQVSLQQRSDSILSHPLLHPSLYDYFLISQKKIGCGFSPFVNVLYPLHPFVNTLNCACASGNKQLFTSTESYSGLSNRYR